MACEKWMDRYELWKGWQKNCRNPWLHKILVLLGIVKSPTFEFYWLDHRWDEAEVLNEVGTVYEAYIDDGEKWQPLEIRLGKGDDAK